MSTGQALEQARVMRAIAAEKLAESREMHRRVKRLIEQLRDEREMRGKSAQALTCVIWESRTNRARRQDACRCEPVWGSPGSF